MRQAQNQMVELEEFAAVCRERDALQDQLDAAEANNAELIEQIAHLEAQAAEARGHFQKQAEKMLIEISGLRKRGQEAEERAVQFQEQIKVQEEVIERLKAQNSRFVEEQREAKQRAASLASDLARAREEVVRLVRLADDFRDRLARVTQEKNDVVKISNGFARERDEIRAEYDARGKVIKKLRKRLHKLKKKLKH